MHSDMTAVTCNLTKLFRMKLKATKCYWSHLTEKTEQIFWPAQYIYIYIYIERERRERGRETRRGRERETDEERGREAKKKKSERER